MVDKEFIIEAMLKKTRCKGGYVAGVVGFEDKSKCLVHINYCFKPGPNGEFFELIDLSKLQEEDFSVIGESK